MKLLNRSTAIPALVVACLTLVFIGASASASSAVTAPVATPGLQSRINKLIAKLPASKTADLDRWKIIQLCLELPQVGVIPSAAQSEVAQGYYFFKHATRANAAVDFEKAADAYARASLIAPCIADYYYNRTIALQQALKYGGSTQDARGAAMSLHWYLTANPGDSQADKNKIIASIGKFEAQAGAKTDSDVGWVPLVWAAYSNNVTAVRALLANGADANATYDFSGPKRVSALASAAADGESHSLEIIKLLIAAGAKVDAQDSLGHTALYYAAYVGEVDVAKYLVAMGANVNHVSNDNEGYTVLGIAAGNGHLNLVKFLVASGAKVNLQDGKDGETPFMLAVNYGHLAVAKYLISVGANVNAHDKSGQTILMYASAPAFNISLESVKFLVSNGANVNDVDKNDLTPLYYAASGGNLTVVQYLVEHGADINWVSNRENYLSVLGISAQNGYLDIIKYLVSSGANVNLHANDGSTPLINAAQNDRPQIARFLLAHHAKVDAADTDGWTALMYAAGYGYLGVAKILVKHGADVNLLSSDQYHDNVLGFAAFYGRLNMVKFLIARGADINAQRTDGETPLDEADASNDKANMKDKMAVADYLSSHGGESGQAVDSATIAPVSLIFLLLVLILVIDRGIHDQRLRRV